MPVRARSASSISAMRCLPPRLMPRSSSSSAIDAVADHAAVARDERRLVDQRAVERVAHVDEVVELGDEAPDQRRLELLEHHPHARDGGDRLAQRHQVARTGGAERRARDQPLDVVHRSSACRAA